MAVTQRAGILDIEPFLKTSCMEEVTARRDHSRFHVLKERLREVPQKWQPFNQHLFGTNRKPAAKVFESSGFTDKAAIRDALLL